MGPKPRRLGNLSRGLLTWFAPVVFFPLSTAKFGISSKFVEAQSSLEINPGPFVVLMLISLAASAVDLLVRCRSVVILGTAGMQSLLLMYYLVQDSAFTHHAHPVHHQQLHAARAVRATQPVPSFPDATGKMSVVLPCLNETYVTHTVRSFCQRTPLEALEEIIVVDDGSIPPMAKVLSEAGLPSDCPYRVLRHEKPWGLMIAKQTGGDAAKGKYIGFFDCHVAPSPHWYKELMHLLDEKPRRLVIPMIGDLDLDTYDMKNEPQVWKTKCYIDFNADFWWYDDETNYVPIISGGLVATSKQWWQESGGFDSGMRGWGGENSDQSLRAWLCGGDVVRAPTSQIAHMWRVSDDKRTQSRFTLTASVNKNLERVAAAWFDKFRTKFEGFHPETNVSESLIKKKQLGCKPYVYYLHRFRKVYIDAAIIPTKVFRIRARDRSKCIYGRQNFYLGACESATYFNLANLIPKGFPTDVDSDNLPAADTNLRAGSVVCGVHRAASCAQCPQGHGSGWCNGQCTWMFDRCLPKAALKNAPESPKKCCSGIREYGSMYCFDALQADGPIRYQCDTMGVNSNQQYIFEKNGLIRHSSGNCLGVDSSVSKLAPVDCNSPDAQKWDKVDEFEPEEFRWYNDEVRLHGLTDDLPDH